MFSQVCTCRPTSSLARTTRIGAFLYNVLCSFRRGNIGTNLTTAILAAGSFVVFFFLILRNASRGRC